MLSTTIRISMRLCRSYMRAALNCDKTYRTKHAAQCHVPKCPEVRNPVKPFSCSECPESFTTQRGLSQHKRHRHPAERNEERMATARPVVRPPRVGSSFAPEEITMMYRLEWTYRGNPDIAQKIAERIGTKVAKQIRDKRREPAYCRRRDQYLKEMAGSLPAVRRSLRASLTGCPLGGAGMVDGDSRRSAGPVGVPCGGSASVSQRGRAAGSYVAGSPCIGATAVEQMNARVMPALDDGGGVAFDVPASSVVLGGCRVEIERCDHLLRAPVFRRGE